MKHDFKGTDRQRIPTFTHGIERPTGWFCALSDVWLRLAMPDVSDSGASGEDLAAYFDRAVAARQEAVSDGV